MAAMVKVTTTLTEVNEIIALAEESTLTRFVIYSKDKAFSNKGWQPTPKNKVYWEWKYSRSRKTATIPFSGAPFMFIGGKCLGCHRGRDKGKKHKEQYAMAKKQAAAQHLLFKQIRKEHTKKVGCPAELNVTRIAIFPQPQFKLAVNKERARKEASALLKEALERSPIAWEEVFYVRVPSTEDHVGHPVMLKNSCPTFLHDKPLGMVTHIMKRMATALGPDNVTLTSDGTFQVHCVKKKGKFFRVTLGSDNTMPACECSDWRQYQMPCKHFCALFKSGWTWDHLCPKYRDNPLFRLEEGRSTLAPSDMGMLKEDEEDEEETDHDAVGLEPLEEPNAALLDHPCEARTRQTPLKRRCLSKLKAIMDCVQVLDGERCLEGLEKRLECLLKEVQLQVATEQGLPLLECPEKRRKCDSLPPPKQENGKPFSDRLGKQVTVPAPAGHTYCIDQVGNDYLSMCSCPVNHHMLPLEESSPVKRRVQSCLSK